MMQEIETVNPFHCRMWALHDRAGEMVTAESCSAEIDSFQRHGQIVPALGRRLNDDLTHRIELIYGARRLFVARHLNTPLKVELREITDKEAIIAMDVENRQRKDISPYERGLSYARWLREGHFKSQDEIARALKVSPSQISRLLSLAKLPAVVIEAFNDPTEICEGWGLEILEALNDDARRLTLIQKARQLIQSVPRRHARDVYRGLLSAAICGRKVRSRSHDEVVKSQGGAPLFRIRHQTKAIALQLPIDRISATNLHRIRAAVVQILEPDSNSGTAPASHSGSNCMAKGPNPT
jgi:ParB family chromosome partitioning protein